MKTFDQLEKNNGSLSLDQVAEEVGIPQTRGQMIPGRFYSLKINPPAVNLTSEVIATYTSGKRYLNLNPIGLLLFHQNFVEKAVMLDLRAMPPQASAKVLEAYYQFSLQNGLRNFFDKDNTLISLENRRLLDQKFYFITTSILSGLVGIDNLYYAVNKYNIDDIVSAKLIDWDNFGKLINPRVSNYGFFPDPINMGEVFEDFLTNSIKQ
jgi:hypothetical protein